MQRNSRHQDGARIATVNDVDLGLRAPQLYGDGDTSFMPFPSDMRMLSEELRTVHGKRVDAHSRIDVESRK
jgi:hypothetical protein